MVNFRRQLLRYESCADNYLKSEKANYKQLITAKQELCPIGVDNVSGNIDRLLRLLKNEYEIYQEILELSKTKKQIIVDGNIKDLDEMTKQEQKMIKIIIGFEKERSALVDKIERDLGIGQVQNITELTAYFEADQQQELNQIKDGLASVVKELGDQNEFNSKLIGQSLEIIDFNMNLLSSSHNQHAGYGSDADEMDVNRKSNLFDVKV